MSKSTLTQRLRRVYPLASADELAEMTREAARNPNAPWLAAAAGELSEPSTTAPRPGDGDEESELGPENDNPL